MSALNWLDFNSALSALNWLGWELCFCLELTKISGKEAFIWLCIYFFFVFNPYIHFVKHVWLPWPCIWKLTVVNGFFYLLFILFNVPLSAKHTTVIVVLCLICLRELWIDELLYFHQNSIIMDELSSVDKKWVCLNQDLFYVWVIFTDTLWKCLYGMQ